MRCDGKQDILCGPLIRSALERDGNRMIIIAKSEAHGWQVSMKRPDGIAFAVEMDRDPIKAIYKCLAPLHVPATPPGGSRSQAAIEAEAKAMWHNRHPEYVANRPHDMFGPVNPKD